MGCWGGVPRGGSANYSCQAAYMEDTQPHHERTRRTEEQHCRYELLVRRTSAVYVATSTVPCVPSTPGNMFNLTRGAIAFKFHWYKAIT